MIDQWLQQPANLVDPVGHHRAIEIDAVTGVDLGLAVQRQVIRVLRDNALETARTGSGLLARVTFPGATVPEADRKVTGSHP